MSEAEHPHKARFTIDEIYKRAERAAQLAAIYGTLSTRHAADAKAAQLACDRFKQSASECRRLAHDIESELEWLVTQLHDMHTAALLRRAGRMLKT